MASDRLKIICGDALHELSTLPHESVDLTVTSPPYDDLRRYEGHSWDFEGIARQLYRVTKQGGVVCWNIGDSVIDGSETLTSSKQKIFFREQCGFRIHDTMIYEKNNFAHPETSRYHQMFEYLFILSKGKPGCFNPIKDKKNSYAGTGPWGVNTMREYNGQSSVRPSNIISEFGMRGNVWRGNTAGSENPCGDGFEHPAMMPRWLAHDLILSWSDANDVVLDPFAGSGTTGKEALELGRHAIVIEISEKYVSLIEQRCNTTMGLALV